jgi:hypothetical protein
MDIITLHVSTTIVITKCLKLFLWKLLCFHNYGKKNTAAVIFTIVQVSAEVEVEVEVNLRPTVSRPVWYRAPDPDFFFLSDDCGVLDVGHPL